MPNYINGFWLIDTNSIKLACQINKGGLFNIIVSGWKSAQIAVWQAQWKMEKCINYGWIGTIDFEWKLN